MGSRTARKKEETNAQMPEGYRVTGLRAYDKRTIVRGRMSRDAVTVTRRVTLRSVPDTRRRIESTPTWTTWTRMP